MKVFIFVSCFELLRPGEVVCEHLHACAVSLVQTRASGMVWSSSYEGLPVCLLLSRPCSLAGPKFSKILMFTCAAPS